VILSAGDLVNEGAIIEQVICVIDRRSADSEALTQSGLKLKALFTMAELKNIDQ